MDSTTEEQRVNAVDRLNQFQKKHDGFLAAEISKDLKEDSWELVFHYENLEKVQAIGTPLRSSKEFMDFSSLIASESLKISFCQQVETW